MTPLLVMLTLKMSQSVLDESEPVSVSPRLKVFAWEKVSFGSVELIVAMSHYTYKTFARATRNMCKLHEKKPA
jgi:hypothetical protein